MSDETDVSVRRRDLASYRPQHDKDCAKSRDVHVCGCWWESSTLRRQGDCQKNAAEHFATVPLVKTCTCGLDALLALSVPVDRIAQQDKDHGGTRLTADAAVSVSASGQLSHVGSCSECARLRAGMAELVRDNLNLREEVDRLQSLSHVDDNVEAK